MITRLRLDAALYAPAPTYTGTGRPRKKGRRWPSLQTVLTSSKTRWRQVKVRWYDGQQRLMALTSQIGMYKVELRINHIPNVDRSEMLGTISNQRNS